MRAGAGVERQSQGAAGGVSGGRSASSQLHRSFGGTGSGFVVVDGAGYAAGGPVVGQFKIGALATVESGHFGIRNDIAAVHPHF